MLVASRTQLIEIAIAAVGLLILFLLAVIFVPDLGANLLSGTLVRTNSVALFSEKATYKQGAPVAFYGSSDCPDTMQVFLNGVQVANTTPVNKEFRQLLTLNLAPGDYRLEGRAGSCRTGSVSFKVEASECASGQTSDCALPNGCTGIRVCVNNGWSACATLPKVCQPGSKRGCTMENSCSYGFKVCNSCGTAYGDCTLG